MKVLLRIDGVLREAGELPLRAMPYLAGRIKVLSDLITYRSDLAQEGRIRYERNGSAVDLRVSVFPLACGEKVVVRVFDPSERLRALERLGLPGAILETLRGTLAGNDGMILFTGPAGSGKTTTIYACLAELAGGEG
ncbi:MAG: ATPase, T2SS/T4P/T4SS family, partial [Planctomycetota bacterium]